MRYFAFSCVVFKKWPGTVDTPSLRERFVTLGGGDAEKVGEE